MKVKNPAKSMQGRLLAKKNPWLNFLREFREKQRGTDKYTGADGNKKLLIDAGGMFKQLTNDQKEKYREYQTDEQLKADIKKSARPKK